MWRLLFAMFLLSLFSSTVSADETEVDQGDHKTYGGTYKVIIFNDQCLIAQGYMILDASYLTKITGAWDLTPVSQDCAHKGPYPIGQGALEGQLENSSVLRLFLNPGILDDNASLSGLVDEMIGSGDGPRLVIRGHWSQSTIAEHASGAFQARQVN